MKKVLIVISVLLIISLVTIFLIFPAKQLQGGSVPMDAPLPVLLRHFPDTAQWQKWWPWPQEEEELNQPKIVVAGISEMQLLLMWCEGKYSIPVALNITPIGKDTSLIVWSSSMEAGNNPIKRVQAFAASQRLKNDIQTMLNAFALYASNPLYAYGFVPEYKQVKDTMLISTNANFSTYPLTNEIYALIKKLENYAASKKAAVSGMPMYHVEAASGVYNIMVALPIDKLIANTDVFKIKRMIDGNLLVAEVKAGPAQLQQLFVQFEQYKADHQLVSPAIPYLQIVTNRLQQSDTTQWISRMCYPIY